VSSADEQRFTNESRYSSVLAWPSASPTLKAIFMEAYGDDYPVEADPFGFVSLSELRAMVDILAGSTVSRLLDVGCGRGGPGLWIARELGASLVGIDVVAEAVVAAYQRAATLGMAEKAEFRVASGTGTHLPEGAFDGAVSIDALWMIQNKAAAFRELARVLSPGSLVVFTTWEPAHLDYAAYLTAAGFSSVVKRPLPDAMQAQIAVYDAILHCQPALRAELGEDAANVLIAEAIETPVMLETAPRMMVSAVRG
jgi:ubiquinone/menaquinone biosynthesis C-methylase UbiE